MGTKTAKQSGSAKRNGTPKAAVEPSDILTLEEAAAFLRVEVSSLQVEAANGRVPGQLIIGQWRFSKSALMDWLKCPAKLRPGSKEAMLAIAGIWKDDPTVDAMIEDIYRRRKAGSIA